MRFVSLLQDHLGLPSKSQGSVSELQRHCLPLRWSISGIWRRKSHCSTRPIARIRPCIAWSFPPKATLRLKCESSAVQQPNVFSHCHSWYFLDLRHCPRTVKFPCYCLLINELFSVGDCNFPLVGRSNLFFLMCSTPPFTTTQLLGQPHCRWYPGAGPNGPGDPLGIPVPSKLPGTSQANPQVLSQI